MRTRKNAAAAVICAALFLLPAGSAAAEGEPGAGSEPAATATAIDPLAGIGTETVTLHPGEQKALTVLEATRVSVGDAEVVAVSAVGSHEVLLTGLKVGSTDITFWSGTRVAKTYRVRVSQSLDDLATQIGELVAEVEGAKVTVVGGKVVIDGRLLTKRDLDRVTAIASAYGTAAILNLCTLDRGGDDSIVESFIGEAAGVDGVKVRIAGDTAYLTGSVQDENQKEWLLKVTETQVQKVIDLIEVENVMIETEIIFLEIRRNEGYDLGKSLFDPGNDASLSVTGSSEKTGAQWAPTDISIAWSVDVLKFINLAIENGAGKVLLRPHIGTRSGEEGYFQSGGQLWYKLEGQYDVQLQEVDYGLILTITPELNSRGEIISAVDISVTVPVEPVGDEDLNLDKFQTRNAVSCRPGQSIIISGLVENLRRHFHNRTPLLGDIPLLKHFFGNMQRQDEDKELVAILTPRIMKSGDLTVPPGDHGKVLQEIKELKPLEEKGR